MLRRPPSEPKDIRLIQIYKNYAHYQGISHIGLGVSAMNNAKVLTGMGIRVEVLGLKSEADLLAYMAVRPDITHVNISALWVSVQTLSTLSGKYPWVQFSCVCHSNVGFLQADVQGIKLLRQYLDLETATSNFHVAGNSSRFRDFIENAYGRPCSYLPNLYFLDHLKGQARPPWAQTGGTLRMGAFGATRPQKNFLSAVATAIEISRDQKAQAEVWINSARNDSGASGSIRMAAQELVAGLPWITLREYPWAPWPTFREFIGTMHLLIQPSYTESFNVVTADGIAEGVPSVVSDAIDWVPSNWQACSDDVAQMARVGVGLLHDFKAAYYGFNSLKNYVEAGKIAWVDYLLHNKFGNQIG